MRHMFKLAGKLGEGDLVLSGRARAEILQLRDVPIGGQAGTRTLVQQSLIVAVHLAKGIDLFARPVLGNYGHQLGDQTVDVSGFHQSGKLFQPAAHLLETWLSPTKTQI